jgi:LCP family protein required for cell wall assembly
MFKYKYLWIGIIAVLLAFLGGMAWGIFRGAPEFLPTSEPVLPTMETEVKEQAGAPTLKPVDTPTPQLISTCGQSGVTTILTVTRDLAGGEWPYGADTVRFVRVDYSQKTIRVIAIPRDLWVRTPVLSFQNTEYSRLGLVYYLMEQATAGSANQKANAGVYAVAQTLFDNFTIMPNHFFAVDMSYAAKAIDEIGGIKVNIPRAITTGSYSFNPGPQQLYGQLALAYSRYLPSNELNAGWERLERQDLVLSALRVRLLEPANFVKIPSLVEKFKENYVSDLTTELISSLVCMLTEVPADQIEFLEITPEMITGPGPDSSMIPDVGKVNKFLQEQLSP